MSEMRIELRQGDIAAVAADAIVNAANSSLLGGGGVDGAIHRAGGPEILAACRGIRARQGGCAVGAAVITTAGRLPARFVIHTVGPIWTGGASGEPELLAACYQRSLALAVANDCHSVAFPCISTGVYRYPKAAAADVAVATVREFLRTDKQLRQVIFVSYDQENFDCLEKALAHD